ncbi:MAG: hypothetical protein K6C69_08730 [Lachnospiraceae bacterium]|nr:hypothetical protein [Lachnospiraceae bacterium]
MKRRNIALLAGIIMGGMLSGCGMVELTSAQEDAIAQYAADVSVEKYKEVHGMLETEADSYGGSSNSSSNSGIPKAPSQASAVDNTSIPQATKASNTADTTGTTETSGTTETTGTTEASGTTGTQTPATTEATQSVSANGSTEMGVEEALSITNVNLSLIGYSVVSSYPEGGIFTVDADAGYRLLVVEYEAVNPSSEEVTMGVDTTGVSIKATINGESTVSVYKTMLKSDLMNMNGIVFKGSEKKTCALIFRVKEDVAESISDISVSTTKR